MKNKHTYFIEVCTDIFLISVYIIIAIFFYLHNQNAILICSMVEQISLLSNCLEVEGLNQKLIIDYSVYLLFIITFTILITLLYILGSSIFQYYICFIYSAYDRHTRNKQFK